jgi:hypothetical protein
MSRARRQAGCGCISKPAGARRGGRLPLAAMTDPTQIGVEAPTVDGVGFARHDREQRRHHFFWFDEPRGAAFAAHLPHLLGHAGCVGTAPGLTT